MLAAGSLEKLIEAIARQLAAWEQEWPSIRQRLASPYELLPAMDHAGVLAAAETTTAFQGFPEGRVD